jgi:hypothetical protein
MVAFDSRNEHVIVDDPRVDTPAGRRCEADQGEVDRAVTQAREQVRRIFNREVLDTEPGEPGAF